MLDAFLQGLSGLPLSAWMRTSVWAFPITNTLHIVGIAILFGTILVVDLRLIGVGKSVTLGSLTRIILPLTIGGFIVAIFTGFLMFIVDPVQYWHNQYFPWKLSLIVVAGLNAGILHLSAWHHLSEWEKERAIAPRIHGAMSIFIWLGVITAGRMMAYF